MLAFLMYSENFEIKGLWYFIIMKTKVKIGKEKAL
jgi:hypothetical protein